MVVGKLWIESGERNVQINLKFPSPINAHNSNARNKAQITAAVVGTSRSKKAAIPKRTNTSGPERTTTTAGQGREREQETKCLTWIADEEVGDPRSPSWR